MLLSTLLRLTMLREMGMMVRVRCTGVTRRARTAAITVAILTAATPIMRIATALWGALTDSCGATTGRGGHAQERQHASSGVKAGGTPAAALSEDAVGRIPNPQLYLGRPAKGKDKPHLHI
ncbi:hypothetical protein Vafri_11576 [Volvox africanus]|nr:hypothetical protein Vafri_11576 [Volvox africanus]